MKRLLLAVLTTSVTACSATAAADRSSTSTSTTSTAIPRTSAPLSIASDAADLIALDNRQLHIEPFYTPPPTPPPTPEPTPAPAPEPVLTPLQIAQSQIGKTGPYARGFWCAKFVSWVLQQANVANFVPHDSPLALHNDALAEGRLHITPVAGDMVFLDLTGHGGHVAGPTDFYVSHVGIVEAVNGNELTTIEGNTDTTGTVQRKTRHLHDGYVLDFAGT
jgi:hypothetical protein